MAKQPTYKIKNVKAGKDPMSGQQLYQQIMMVDYDGKTSSYKTGRHTSRERVRDDLNRMMATVSASLQETPQAFTAKQNYGEAEFRTIGSPEIAETVRGGGQLKAPETFELSRNVRGMQNIQRYDQRGIRQGESITRPYANMLDPNYDLATDTVKAPAQKDGETSGLQGTPRTSGMQASTVADVIGQAGLLSDLGQRPTSLLGRSRLRSR